MKPDPLFGWYYVEDQSTFVSMLGQFEQQPLYNAMNFSLNIWDPQRSMTIRAEDGHSRADFSVYEGWAVTGVPRITIRRGEIVFNAGELTARPGSGRVLPDGWRPMPAKN